MLTAHLHASRQLNARQAEKVKCLEERLSQASEEQLSTNQIVIQLSTERDQLTTQVRWRRWGLTRCAPLTRRHGLLTPRSFCSPSRARAQVEDKSRSLTLALKGRNAYALELRTLQDKVTALQVRVCARNGTRSALLCVHHCSHSHCCTPAAACCCS